MATTHVFIVDVYTFNAHLKYLFAGTGAGTDSIDFNNSRTTTLYAGRKHGGEKKLVSMAADASRIRRGDKIIFYLQQNGEAGVPEGKFFGVFKATQNWSFLDNNGYFQYLFGIELNKLLLYRTLLEPDTVYPKGITEWEALESITGLTSPSQMIWSLIYRKIKANRGNTMVTIYESERLCRLIKDKNNGTPLVINNNQLSFDKKTKEISVVDSPKITYAGRQEVIDYLPRLLQINTTGKQMEFHLQWYIIKNIGLGTNPSLDSAVLGNNFSIEWLGNEVLCGAGMQRIDIALSVNYEDKKVFTAVELKDGIINPGIVNQINRYVDWIEQYYIPNRKSEILPAIIAKKYINKADANYVKTINSFNTFNTAHASRCKGIKYIEYEITGNNLIFNSVPY